MGDMKYEGSGARSESAMIEAKKVRCLAKRAEVAEQKNKMMRIKLCWDEDMMMNIYYHRKWNIRGGCHIRGADINWSGVQRCTPFRC